MSGLAKRAAHKCLLYAQNNAWSTISKRGFLYNWRKGINRDTMIWLQRPIDMSPGSIGRWLEKKNWQALVDKHKFDPEKFRMLGPDLAAAYFIVERDGAIKFEDHDTWIRKNKDGRFDLPTPSPFGVRLEAIDASSTKVMYESFETVCSLNHLKYLNLSKCEYVDDWCLDRMVQFRRSLQVLDLSGCPNISERGLACLHKLVNLKRLILRDMPGIRQAKLTVLMLEETLPNCFIEGIDYTDINEDEEQTGAPSLVRSWENVARSDQLIMAEDLLRDHKLIQNKQLNKQ